MPGISTEYLAEQIEASNERLAKAIEDLARKVEEGVRKGVWSRVRKGVWGAKRGLEPNRQLSDDPSR